MRCEACVFFPVYCHVLCEVCQQLPVDPMIIQPILEELDSSLKRCFSKEAEGLYTLQKERENLQLLAAGVASINSSQMALSLSFDGEFRLLIKDPVVPDFLIILLLQRKKSQNGGRFGGSNLVLCKKNHKKYVQ